MSFLPDGVFKAVVDVVVRYVFLALPIAFSTACGYGAGDFQAAAPFLQHGNNAFEVPQGAFESLDYVGVSRVCRHSDNIPIPLGRMLPAFFAALKSAGFT